VQNCVGIPYGSPLSAVISNLYLTEIDHYFSAQSDLFYVRYADDILLAHPDKAVVSSMEDVLGDKVKELGLSMAENKEERICFSNAGFAPSDSNFEGSTALPYLGFIIHANGKYQASKRRTHRYLNLCKELIDEVASHNSGLPAEKVGQLVCDQLKKSLFNADEENFLYHDGSRNYYSKTRELLVRTNEIPEGFLWKPGTARNSESQV